MQKRKLVHKSPQQQTQQEWLADLNGESVPSIQHPAPIAPVNEHDLDQGEGEVEEHPLVPAGGYQAVYLHHKIHPNYQGYGDKLVVSFSVTDGDHAGEIIRSYYNITITNTGFTSKGGSRWVKEMRRLF